MTNDHLLEKVEISIQDQQLRLTFDDEIVNYSISTSKLGIGQQKGSNQTPLGWHQIRAKIGAGATENTVFIGRRPTGEIYSPELAAQFPQRDWILTRILWLSGCEIGNNRLGSVDSMQRYIYIHGTPDSEPMGRAESHGCVRMRNTDVIELFDALDVGTLIWIQKLPFARISCRSV
ncbi:MAG: L,D-transpeptidase [Oleispira antarctica]|uniref:ErfK/YbiS/YcfS/YnhG family protein n=1 Tax=Oleispira antarctica RB-8 TaxID=698738 RepID=R4YTK4_OLEAN|nr:L,D-transpeptidase [Oleispira antarctica]MBQ0793833.1 L,D-transpeptidase [Oleispira antarctica]CCK75874.1 ErfK/YbiS/YcfS/YnhG family protein [Oleispira antarctica RB-8]